MRILQAAEADNRDRSDTIPDCCSSNLLSTCKRKQSAVTSSTSNMHEWTDFMLQTLFTCSQKQKFTKFELTLKLCHTLRICQHAYLCNVTSKGDCVRSENPYVTGLMSMSCSPSVTNFPMRLLRTLLFDFWRWLTKPPPHGSLEGMQKVHHLMHAARPSHASLDNHNPRSESAYACTETHVESQARKSWCLRITTRVRQWYC